MNAEGSPPPLPECRVRARRLLKQLRSGTAEAAAQAAERFRRLRSFSPKTVEQVLEDRDKVQLKHALAVIALEHGHESWAALKASAIPRKPNVAGPAEHEMYVPTMDVFLNRWFANYEDAHVSLEEEGGYLLPYGRQFFVCEAGAIRALGLRPDDPDWERIGHDWARPRDAQAWSRLKERREQASMGAGSSA